MWLRILSGGQTGADQGALRAARAAGVPTAGWAARRFMTEDGPAPWLAGYGLRECPDPGYPARTRRNVRSNLDGMLWFGDPSSAGGRLTFSLCGRARVPTFTVLPDTAALAVRDWVASLWGGPGRDVRLLVAGNRESSNPGIAEVTERFLGEVLVLLARSGKLGGNDW